MARCLKRSRSNIGRKLRGNADKDGRYSAFEAERKYRQRRERCIHKRQLDDPGRKTFMEEKLREYWSPEQIAGRLKVIGSKLQVSYSTIYRAIYAGQLEIAKKCLRGKGRKASPHDEETQGRLHGYKTIHDRPRAANTRSQFGHWEGDTVQEARGKGTLATFVDRRSGFLVARLLPNRKAKVLSQAQCAAFASFPPSLLRSFTVDNGNEFFDYQAVEKILGTKEFFADPGCPGRRGLNENTNGLLRQYFPKKFDFSTISAQDLLAVVAALNNRPHKRLAFRSPDKCFPLHRLLHLT